MDSSKYEEYYYSVRPHVSRIRRNRGQNQSLFWTSGTVLTEHGIVEVYAQEGHTSLLFVQQGRCHVRQWRKEFQPRAIVTLAKRFAKDMAGE